MEWKKRHVKDGKTHILFHITQNYHCTIHVINVFQLAFKN